MKKVLTLLAVLPLAVFSQGDILNNSLVKPSLHQLFIGVNNEIQYTGTAKGVMITLSHGTVSAGKKPNTWVVKCSSSNPDTITIKTKTKVLLKQVMEVKKVPNPKANLAGSVTTISMPMIKADPNLHVTLPNCALKIRLKITQFDIVGDTDGTTIGNKLSKNNITFISTLKPGTKFTITGIKAVGPDGVSVTLPDLALTFK
jgi:hypothetical protein